MSEVTMRGSAGDPARQCRAAPSYDESTLATLPPDAVAGATGCGDPVGLCELLEGDVVLNVGSGTGLDTILASRRVGVSGRVIGVDQWPDMVTSARATLEAIGVGNVEIQLAAIEALPVPTASIDWVIANCAIALSHDKPRVFSEIARVLKPGARMQIADVFTHGLPDELDVAVALVGSCVAGATSETEYIAGLTKAGLVDLAVGGRYVYDQSELAAMFNAMPPGSGLEHQGTDLAAALVGGVWRAYVFARKPDKKRRPWAP